MRPLNRPASPRGGRGGRTTPPPPDTWDCSASAPKGKGRGGQESPLPEHPLNRPASSDSSGGGSDPLATVRMHMSELLTCTCRDFMRTFHLDNEECDRCVGCCKPYRGAPWKVVARAQGAASRTPTPRPIPPGSPITVPGDRGGRHPRQTRGGNVQGPGRATPSSNSRPPKRSRQCAPLKAGGEASARRVQLLERPYRNAGFPRHQYVPPGGRTRRALPRMPQTLCRPITSRHCASRPRRPGGGPLRLRRGGQHVPPGRRDSRTVLIVPQDLRRASAPGHCALRPPPRPPREDRSASEVSGAPPGATKPHKHLLEEGPEGGAERPPFSPHRQRASNGGSTAAAQQTKHTQLGRGSAPRGGRTKPLCTCPRPSGSASGRARITDG